VTSCSFMLCPLTSSGQQLKHPCRHTAFSCIHLCFCLFVNDQRSRSILKKDIHCANWGVCRYLRHSCVTCISSRNNCGIVIHTTVHELASCRNLAFYYDYSVLCRAINVSLVHPVTFDYQSGIVENANELRTLYVASRCDFPNVYMLLTLSAC